MDTSVTIIVPLYFGKKYMCRLQNIIAKNCLTLQDANMHVDCELLFVNDSPEEAIDDAVLQGTTYAKNFSVRVVNPGSNQGIHGARVFGLKNASGEYVVFLDQDDIISDDYVLTQLSFIGTSDAVLGNAFSESCFGRRKNVLYSSVEMQQNAVKLQALIDDGNHITSPGQVLIKKRSIPPVWCENVMKKNGADDYFLWLVMLAGGRTFALNPKCVYTHVLTGSNVSSDAIAMCVSVNEMIAILKEKKIFPENELNKLVAKHANTPIVKIAEMAKIFEAWLLKTARGGAT